MMKGSILFLSLILFSILAVAPAMSASSSSEHSLTITLIGEVTAFVYTSDYPFPILVMQNETVNFTGTATVKFIVPPVYWLLINGTLYKTTQYSFTVNTSETLVAKTVAQPVYFKIILLNQGTMKILYGNNTVVTNKTVTISVPWDENITLESSKPFIINESGWCGASTNYLEFSLGYQTAILGSNVTAIYIDFVNVSELRNIFTPNPEAFVHLIFNGTGTLLLTTNETIWIAAPHDPNTLISQVNASTAFVANLSTWYVAEMETVIMKSRPILSPPEVTIYSPTLFYVNGTKALNLTKPVNVFGHEEHFAYTFKDSGDMTLIITFPQNKTTTTTTTTTTTSTNTSTTTSTSTTTTTSTSTTTTSSTTTTTTTTSNTTTTTSTSSTASASTSTTTTNSSATASSSTSSTTTHSSVIVVTPTETTTVPKHHYNYLPIIIAVIVIVVVAYLILRKRK